MFKQQEQALIETVNSASTLISVRIDKLSADITKNSEKLIQLSKDVTDVQVGIDASQQLLEEKVEALEQQFENERKESINYFKSIEAENNDLKDKLWDFEDRSRRDNLRFDGSTRITMSRGMIKRRKYKELPL